MTTQIEDPQAAQPDHGSDADVEALIREARRRTRRRRLRVAVTAFPAVGTVTGGFVAFGSQAARSSGTVSPLPADSRAPSATTFALVTQKRRGPGSNLGIYSVKTGRLVRALGTYSDRVFTNNGLAYDPREDALYFTLIPQNHRARRFVLRLMRLDIASGRSRFVADGSQPEVSSSGTELAYGTFPEGLAVRDLRTGQTRTVRLPQLGVSANLMSATIGWLGDGTDLAIVPMAGAWDLVGKPPKYRWCGTSQSNPVVVFVHVPPPPAALTADCVRVPGGPADGRVLVGADPASPTSALVTTMTRGGGTLVEQISQTGSIKPAMRIPNSLPLTFDAPGTHLIYLAGHLKPTLTETSLTGLHPVAGPWRERLLTEAAAW